MKKGVICLALAVLPLLSYAQGRAVKYSVVYNRDKTHTIHLDNRGFGRNTILIHLENMKNANVENPIIYTTSPGVKNDSVRFGRKDPAQYMEYSKLRSWIVPGTVNMIPDTLYGFSLPCEPGKDCTPSFIGSPTDLDLMGFQFTMHAGDMVCAVREGTVVKVADATELRKEEPDEFFSNEKNHITIQHDDGSQAEYSVLRHRSFKVTTGDRVARGTPLAAAGTLDGEKYQARIIFFFYFHDRSRNFDPDKGSASIIDRKYMIPYFLTEYGKAQLDWGYKYSR